MGGGEGQRRWERETKTTGVKVKSVGIVSMASGDNNSRKESGAAEKRVKSISDRGISSSRRSAWQGQLERVTGTTATVRR